MNDISAAVGIGQLSRIDEIVSKRISCAEILLEAIAPFDFMIPQYTPSDRTHSYYTLSVEYRPDSKSLPSWREFYQQYKSIGADGFYAVVSVPYLEPSLAGFNFRPTNGDPLCPRAEHLQSNVMCFKTNYRDISAVQHQAQFLASFLGSL